MDKQALQAADKWLQFVMIEHVLFLFVSINRKGREGKEETEGAKNGKSYLELKAIVVERLGDGVRHVL